MTTKPDDIARLGRAVRSRRIDLQMTQDDVAAAGGPSDVTIRKIESGHARKINAATLGKLDAGLGWESGTAASHLAGNVGQVVDSAPIPVSLHEASDAALLAEIARRFDLARSARDRAADPEPRPDTDAPVARDAQPDGTTTEPDYPWLKEDFDFAAMKGVNRGREMRERQDREAEEGGA